MRLVRLLAICVALAAPGSVAAEPEAYFPSRLWTERTFCLFAPSRRLALMDDHRAHWYGEKLAALDEVSLASAGPDSWRFLWLPSFHAPLVVRIDQSPDGGLVMTAKRLSPGGDHDPPSVAKHVRRPLTLKETAAFRALVGRARLARDGRRQCNAGLDGAQWIVEARVGGRYRFHDEWAPESGPVADLGRYLIELTGWAVEPVY